MATAIGPQPLTSESDNQDQLLQAQQTVVAMEDLLATLEKFESALADPSVTLKQMEPLVTSMQQKAQDLHDIDNQIDPGLSNLADQIATYAQIEAIKFQRGDYI
jgi:hypothetical protein